MHLFASAFHPVKQLLIVEYKFKYEMLCFVGLTYLDR